MPIRIANRRFAPSLLGTILALVGIALFARLGVWQLDRADEKQQLLSQYAAAAEITTELSAANAASLTRYQHIHARGRYDTAHQILLDNMPSAQVQPGMHVLTPFELEQGGRILVDRGWIPMGATRAQLPDVGVGDELRTVKGRLDALPRAGIELKNPDVPAGAPWPRVMNYPQQGAVEAALGSDLIDGRLLLNAQEPDGYLRAWQGPVSFGPEKHIGYAVQWFGLATAALVIYLIVSLRRDPS